MAVVTVVRGVEVVGAPLSVGAVGRLSDGEWSQGLSLN